MTIIFLLEMQRLELRGVKVTWPWSLHSLSVVEGNQGQLPLIMTHIYKVLTTWRAPASAFASPLPSYLLFTRTSDAGTVISISPFQLSTLRFGQLARRGMAMTQRS